MVWMRSLYHSEKFSRAAEKKCAFLPSWLQKCFLQNERKRENLYEHDACSGKKEKKKNQASDFWFEIVALYPIHPIHSPSEIFLYAFLILSWWYFPVCRIYDQVTVEEAARTLLSSEFNTLASLSPREIDREHELSYVAYRILCEANAMFSRISFDTFSCKSTEEVCSYAFRL